VPIIHLGVSHRSIGSGELATLGALGRDLPTLLMAAPPAIRGVILLATCNRFELYVDATEFHPAVESVRALILSLTQPALPEVDPALVVHVGEGAVEHLFLVASGLDSVVVGEREIAGQVRLALAEHDATASPALRRLFQAALTTSKAVASSTMLGASGRSLAGVGLDLLADRFFPLEGRRVLLQGTGAYAGVVLAELLRRGVDEILVYSGTGRADAFAASHSPATPVRPEDLQEALAWADAVVCCSGTGSQTLTADTLADARIGRTAPLPVLDLAMAGDVAPEVSLLPQVVVIDLDEVSRNAPAEQADAVAAAMELVRSGVATFSHVEGGRRADPAVTAIRSYVAAIIEAEIVAAERRHTPETADAVARSLRRVSNALLHTPSIRAAELARTGDLEDYRNALHTLFGIDVEVRP
jgi:glutamyl-tRNA reductase